MSGILSTSHSFNKEFIRLLSYYNIEAGDATPMWGIKNKNFSYFACRGFLDQINLYRFQRLAKGGIYYGATFLECVDSTNTLDMPFKYHLYNPWCIPEYIEDDYELCVQETIENYKMTSEYITILWSGGIDSSAILSGFIKYFPKDRFSIACTNGSIEEYPLFYEYLIKNNYDVIDLEKCNLSNLPGLIVHGVGGGVICDTAPIFSEKKVFSNPWHESISKHEWGDDYNSLYEFSEKFLINYGKHNPTVADLCLFANMSTKSNNSVMYLHYDYNLKIEKLSPFYDHHIFRRWNYFHAEKYMIDIHYANKYKLPAKKIIFDILHDSNYMNSKGKGHSQDLWKKKCSVGDKFDTTHNYFFIDYTQEKIFANNKEEFFEKYQNRFDNYFYKLKI